MNCSKCGNEYDDVFNFCPECAEPKSVDLATEAKVKKYRLPKGKTLSIIALSLIVLLLATTVVFVVLFFGANSAKNEAKSDLSAVTAAYADIESKMDEIVPLIESSSNAFLAQAMELINYGTLTANWTEQGKQLGSDLGKLMGIANQYKEENK